MTFAQVMSRPTALTVALIGLALAVCAGASADGLPARNQRHRVGRSFRLAADHSSDACHEGETQSLDAHFGRHSQLDLRNEAQGDGESATGRVAAEPARTAAAEPFRHSTPLVLAPDRPAPALICRGRVRGRAPPPSIL